MTGYKIQITNTPKEAIAIVAKQMEELGYEPVEWGDCQNTIVCKLMTMIGALTIRVKQLEENISRRDNITFNTVGE